MTLGGQIGILFLCNRENEGKGIDAVWEESIPKLGQWMIKQKMLPNLAAIICDRLSAWRNQSSPKVTVSPFLGLRGTVNAQDKAGWRGKVAQFKVGQKCSRGTLCGLTTKDQEKDGWRH